MVKFQVLRIARPLKEFDNPFLLLSVEQFLTMMVPIVVAATIQILIHRQAKSSGMAQPTINRRHSSFLGHSLLKHSW